MTEVSDTILHNTGPGPALAGSNASQDPGSPQ